MKRILLITLIILQSIYALSQDVYISSNTDSIKKSNTVVIPFSFYLKSFGVTAAIDVASRGFIQAQATSTLVGLISTNNSKYLYWEADNFQIPIIKRLFISPNVNIAHYGALDLYQGSNDSNEDAYSSIESDKIEGELQFKYLLPLGYGRDHIINRIKLENGLPTKSTQTHSNNTFSRTFLESSLFYQNQSLYFPNNKISRKYAGLNICINHENIDFKDNPSIGIQTYYKYWIAPNIFNSTIPWTMHEFSLSKYINIDNKNLRSQVIALNIWGRNVDSWNKYHSKDNEIIYHRPSPFMGANLGGRYRFRGYPEARYYDASSLLYSCEYRLIPYWNPLKNWKFLQKLNINIDWLQFVAFIETGKVSSEWDLRNLHTKMKFDYGVGFRFFANEMVIRVDSGFSIEGSQLQMYIGQSF